MKPLESNVKRTVLVVGTISSGKSTVLNALTGTAFFTVPAGSAPELRSKEVQRKGTAGTTVYVEVPDISRVVNSMQKTNDVCVKKLLQLCSSGVSSVLFCYPITHVRCEADMQKVLQFVQTLFKKRVPDFGLVFTFCSMLKEEELDKAKKGVAVQVQKLFQEALACRSVNVCYFSGESGSGVENLRKFVAGAERLPVKELTSWAEMETYLDKERKESCEMLLEFADIIEEQKELMLASTEPAKKKAPIVVEEIEDLPSDVLINALNETKAIRTKTELLQKKAGKRASTVSYEQKELAREKEKSKGRFSKLTQALVLKK